MSAFFPALAPGAGVAFDEIARRHGDYALCGVAALVRLDTAGAVVEARAGYLSVAEVPTVVDLTAELAGPASPTPPWPQRGRGRWPASIPPTTSTPPRPTGPSWCAC